LVQSGRSKGVLRLVEILDWGKERENQPAENSAVRRVRAGGVLRSVVFSFTLSATTQLTPHELCDLQAVLEFLYEELSIPKSPNLMKSE